MWGGVEWDQHLGDQIGYKSKYHKAPRMVRASTVLWYYYFFCERRARCGKRAGTLEPGNGLPIPAPPRVCCEALEVTNLPGPSVPRLHSRERDSTSRGCEDS